MEYIIKHTQNSRGKERKIHNTAGDLLLTMSQKLSSAAGKEVVYDKKSNISYLVDSFEQRGNHQSIIYDSKSSEILTVYLSKTFSGLNLYISSPNKKFAANHTGDMSTIHIYQDNEIAATIRSKRTLFGNNYILDVNPYKDNEFIHLLTIVITRLIEYNADALMVRDVYYN